MERGTGQGWPIGTEKHTPFQAPLGTTPLVRVKFCGDISESDPLFILLTPFLLLIFRHLVNINYFRP